MKIVIELIQNLRVTLNLKGSNSAGLRLTSFGKLEQAGKFEMKFNKRDEVQGLHPPKNISEFEKSFLVLWNVFHIYVPNVTNVAS